MSTSNAAQATVSPQRSAVLIVEPEPASAVALAAILAHSHSEVVVARSHAAALAELARPERRFDAAIVDWTEAGARGSNLLANLRDCARPIFTVVTTVRHDDAVMRKIVGAGAVEILFKPVGAGELVDAVARAIDAGTSLRAAMRRPMLVRAVKDAASERPISAPHPLANPSRPYAHSAELEGVIAAFAKAVRLSPRESAVLRFIALGYRYTDIAELLEISARTVKMHAANVRRKAGVRSRYDLLRRVFLA